MDVITPMGINGDLGTGYSHLLDNPVLFLLFSHQAKAEFSMLLSLLGDLDKCIVIQAYSDTASRINDDRVISIELTDPGHDTVPRQQLSAAIRRTKLHKYSRGRDITVCAILEGGSDCDRELAVCEQLYGDLKDAYPNHVYFDFYIMINEGFIPDASLKLSAHISALRAIEKKDWTRYIFLVFDITNEERLIEGYSERFQAVLNSIILTNCRSSSGASSAYIHERLLEESSTLESKFLSLGGIRMALDETAAKSVIRHELLEYVQQLSDRPQIKLGKLDLSGLGYDILVSIEKTYPGIMQIGFYRGTEKESIAQYSNEEVISRYFQSNADHYMRSQQRQLEEEFEIYMRSYCQHKIRAWLMSALAQSRGSIVQRSYCQAIFQRAIEEVKGYREKMREACQDNEIEYTLWKGSMAKVSRWTHWILKNHQYEQYRILKEWVVFRGKALAGIIFDQCLSDIEYYIRKWAYRMEEHCNLFSRCRLNARENLEELMDDCCNAERYLIQGYHQEVVRELKNVAADIQHIYGFLNDFLREDLDMEYIERSIKRCVDWLYAQRSRDIKLYREPDSNIFDEVLANLKNHTYLFMRTQIPNIVPYIFLMGHPKDSFLNYVRQKDDVQFIVYDTEYMEEPVTFYYQHIR